jgi:hypothetical protein
VGGVERIKISKPQNPDFRGLSEALRQGIIDEEKRVVLIKPDKEGAGRDVSKNRDPQ